MINPKPQTSLQKFLQKINWQTLLISLLLAGLAAGLFFLFRRLKIQNPKKKRENHNQLRDTSLYVGTTINSNEPENLNEPRRTSEEEKYSAWLIPLKETGLVSQVGKFPLPMGETIIGSDFKQCDLVLQGPTISPLHARIFMDSTKVFNIADMGSAGGTWINYAPVSQQGAHLEHGDLVNIGAIVFRFELANPEIQPIRAIPYKEG